MRLPYIMSYVYSTNNAFYHLSIVILYFLIPAVVYICLAEGDNLIAELLQVTKYLTFVRIRTEVCENKYLDVGMLF